MNFFELNAGIKEVFLKFYLFSDYPQQSLGIVFCIAFTYLSSSQREENNINMFQEKKNTICIQIILWKHFLYTTAFHLE